jgi:hypothetical protein
MRRNVRVFLDLCAAGHGARPRTDAVGFSSEHQLLLVSGCFLHRFSWCLSQLSPRTISIAVFAIYFRDAGGAPNAKPLKRNDVIVGSMLRPRQNGEFSAERAGVKNCAANEWSRPFEVHCRSQSEGEFDGESCSTSSDVETQLEILAFLPVVANPKRLVFDSNLCR